jgi:outer membrane protein OmpA-like peptidoglycan-associated protein
LLRIYPIQEEVVVPVENIFFEPNSTELARRAQTGLDQMLEFLLDNPDVQMEIRGHTNNLCSEGYCLELSLKRAKSARRYLLEKGVLGEQLRAAGYGRRQPIASNDTEEGRAQNQRVEFVILGRVPVPAAEGE